MDNSPFTRVPAELREQIFSLALHQSDGVAFTRRYDWGPPSFSDAVLDTNPILSTPYPLALAQTCRAIRSESEDFFYKLNAFRVECESIGGPWPAFQRFLELLGHEHIAELRQVEMVVDDGVELLHYDGFVNNYRELLEQLIWLRQWCLQQPQVVGFEVRFGWGVYTTEETVAIIDLRNLALTLEPDTDRPLPDYSRRVLRECVEKLRTVTLETECKPFYLLSQAEYLQRQEAGEGCHGSKV